jgi:hypothetical protein
MYILLVNSHFQCESDSSSNNEVVFRQKLNMSLVSTNYFLNIYESYSNLIDNLIIRACKNNPINSSSVRRFLLT